MDQDSTRDGSATSEKRNWRDRLGVNKGLPKLSDEFKPRAANARPETSGLRADDEAQPASGSERPGESDRETPARRPTPVERPAPMAPRMPTRSSADTASQAAAAPSRPQAAVIRPPGTAIASPGNGRPPMSSSPKPPTSAPKAEQREAANLSAGQASARSPGPQPAKAQAAARTSSDEFGERLRAQREAAERLVQQRLAAARQKAAQPDAPKPENGEPKAKPQASSEERPRFTFADEEIAAAKREGPSAASPPLSPSPPPYTPSNSNFQRPAPRSAEVPARVSETYARSAPSPYAGAKLEPLAAYRPAAAAVSDPAVGREPEQPRGNRGKRLEGERRSGRRGQQARELDYVEEDLDEVFEEERPARRPVRRRPNAADYSAAYRGYEDSYDDEEPRRRSGPVILLLSLLAVAAIAGGLIYWYQQQQTVAAPAAETGDVPVVTAPQEPVKTEPEAPQPTQQQALRQPQGRKQIYDRILGEETLEPERIVPTEEQPQQPQQPQQQQSLPEAQQPPAQQQQLTPPASQTLTPPPAAQQNGQQTEPLPLPLPPPPGTGEQGSLDAPARGTQDRASSGLQVPEPAANTLQKSNAAEDSRKSATANADSTETSSLASEPGTDDGVVAPTRKAKPEPAAEAPAKPKKQAARSSKSERPRALEGDGPVQISPIPLVPQSDQSATLGQQSRTSQGPAPSARERRIGRDKDPLEGLRSPFTGPNTNRDQGSVGRIASSDQDAAQPVVQRAVQTTEAPLANDELAARQAQQQVASQIESDLQAPAPQAQAEPQVAVVAPEPQDAVATPKPQAAESTSQEYVVQLASFRSEAEAKGEFQRLTQRHPSLVGTMNSRVERSELGAAGTFYRLGVGPLANKDAASKLCNSLIAAGEKDCLVRRQ